MRKRMRVNMGSLISLGSQNVSPMFWMVVLFSVNAAVLFPCFGSITLINGLETPKLVALDGRYQQRLVTSLQTEIS